MNQRKETIAKCVIQHEEKTNNNQKIKASNAEQKEIVYALF